MMHNWNDLLGEIVKLQYLTEMYKKTESEEIYLQIRAALKRVKKEFKHIHELAECGEDISKADFDTMMRKKDTL